MEAAILAAETRVKEIETTLDDPSFYVTRSREAAALIEEAEQTKAEISRLYARWEELRRARRLSSVASRPERV